MTKFVKNSLIFCLFLLFMNSSALSSPKNADRKVKFYDFDDLLINGQFKKPQVLYVDSREKLRFERLMKLKKDFLPKLKNTQKDPSLR